MNSQKIPPIIASHDGSASSLRLSASLDFMASISDWFKFFSLV